MFSRLNRYHLSYLLNINEWQFVVASPRKTIQFSYFCFVLLRRRLVSYLWVIKKSSTRTNLLTKNQPKDVFKNSNCKFNLLRNKQNRINMLLRNIMFFLINFLFKILNTIIELKDHFAGPGFTIKLYNFL